MLYLDTSSLLKAFFAEPESDAVDAAFTAEGAIVISPLTELEAKVQLRARQLGGQLTRSKYNSALAKLESFREADPFVFRPLTGTIFATALRRHGSTREVHCRSLDRLHLAAMEEFELTRLMTHDARLAGVARAMGFEVLMPGVGSVL